MTLPRPQSSRFSRSDIERHLRECGGSSRPDVSHLAEAHIDAMVGEATRLEAARLRARAGNRANAGHSAGRRTGQAAARRSPSRGAAARRTPRAFAFASAMVILGVPAMAFADALPDPVQRAMVKAGHAIGLDVPERATSKDSAVDTRPDRASTTHGSEVRDVARGDSHGREHGEAVARVASDGRRDRRGPAAAADTATGKRDRDQGTGSRATERSAPRAGRHEQAAAGKSARASRGARPANPSHVGQAQHGTRAASAPPLATPRSAPATRSRTTGITSKPVDSGRGNARGR